MLSRFKIIEPEYRINSDSNKKTIVLNQLDKLGFDLLASGTVRPLRL